MSKALLAEAVDIRRWLERDAETPYETRLARDRDIGRGLSTEDDAARVIAWWQTIDKTGEESSGAKITSLERLATASLTGLGILIGLSVGSIAFAFDGQHPVNLLALLGVTVGIPFILLMATVVFLVAGKIPGMNVFRDTISTANPGRWAGAWLNRVSGQRLYGGFSTSESRFARWQLTVFSQWLATGYFLGLLLVGWTLVAVTDLAFGWSTTLAMDADTVHQLFRALSVPWQSLIPAAAPDLALVEASRFYRLETDLVSASQAAQLGRWWPFVLMTILFWGLLPRILLLMVSQNRRRAAIQTMLLQDPEVVSLLDRISLPRIDFGPQEASQSTDGGRSTPPPPELPADAASGIAIWNDALSEEAARHWLRQRLGTPGGPLLDVGGRTGTAETEGRIDQFTNGLSRVVVFTKGWEPPMLEFTDFLAQLRESGDNAATIIVAPINTGGTGIDKPDRDVWAGFLARHEDPRLYVFQASEEGAQ